MHAARLGGALGDAVEGSLTRRLERLDDLLIRPVLAASQRASARGTKIVIVPPGILAGIPWSMLGGLFGHPVTVPSSATRWLADRNRAASDDRRGTETVGFVTGPGVPRASEEVRRAAAAWPTATVVEGPDATTAAAAELAAEVDVFHVTGHGRHAAANPHFSGIELVDGPWFGYDIERLRRMPSTVVISACELGRSSVGWGHEALGMARTWLQAGARSVIASPVCVNDDDACEVLSEVHSGLADGISPVAALAEATERTGIATPFLCYGSGW
nr:CHAT domain-containing protein [Planctomonas sp. JC2975]